MAGHCADCDGCCRVFEVKEVDKAFGEPCKHLGRTPNGPGCTIYDSRPMACKNYVCLWLDSQRRPNTTPFPENLRPNVCKVVMGWPWGIEKETLFVYPYPGFENNWKLPPVSIYLRSILAKGAKLMIVTGKTRIAINRDMAVIGTEEEFAKVLD